MKSDEALLPAGVSGENFEVVGRLAPAAVAWLDAQDVRVFRLETQVEKLEQRLRALESGVEIGPKIPADR